MGGLSRRCPEGIPFDNEEQCVFHGAREGIVGLGYINVVMFERSALVNVSGHYM